MIFYFKEFSWKKEVFIIGFAIVIFAFFGPFGTFDDLGFAIRLLFWAVAILGCSTIFWFVFFLFDRFALFNNSSKFIRHIFIVIIVTIPGTLLIYYNNIVFRDIAIPPEQLLWLWFTVFSIGMILTSIHFFSYFGKIQSKEEIHKEEVDRIHVETDENISLFFAKLPQEIGTDLISLSAHDHYIEVITKKGKKMLHMKFSTAMELLENYPGTRIHRSHWVANNAVESVKKNGRKKSVKLVDGRILPISAKYKSSFAVS